MTNTQAPVLVLGAEPRVSITLARSLRRRGIPSVIAGFAPGERKLASRMVAEWVILPNYRETPRESYSALSRLLSERRFDMLMPTTDTALTMVADHYEELSRLTCLACPTPTVIRRALDKSQTIEAARRCDFPVPATYKVASLDDLQAIGQRLRFPVIAKPEDKAHDNPFKLRYFQNLDELTTAFRTDSRFGMRNMIQEFASGDGVGIGVLMHKGQPVAMFQHRRLKELPATGGVSVTAISEPLDPVLVKHALSLLKEIEWDGVAMVEFKYDRINRRPLLMEVNGRYWGSVSLAVQAGVDFPFLDWQIRRGARIDGPQPYKAGVRWRWGTGDLLRIHDLFRKPSADISRHFSRWRELLGFIWDFRPGARQALWSFADPVPAIQEIGNELRPLAKAEASRVARSMLPPSLVESLRVARSLPSPANRIFLGRRLKRILRLQRDNARALPPQIRSVLFVCHGNIMRSALAEALLRKHFAALKDGSIEVFSAGTHARSGKHADARVVAVGQELGLDLSAHRAEPVTGELLRRADLVVAMDFCNEAILLALAPDQAERVRLLGVYGGETNCPSLEIPDPYERSFLDVRQCCAALQACVDGLARQLLQRMEAR